jgi:hypothetical protein
MSWTIHWYFKGYNKNALSLSMGNIQKRRHNLGQSEQGKKYIVAWTQSGGHNINKKQRYQGIVRNDKEVCPAKMQTTQQHSQPAAQK